MIIFEKIQNMTPEEFAEAASLGLACLMGGCASKDRFEQIRPMIDGLSQVMKEGFKQLLTEMPWEEAIWELLEGMTGKG